MGFGFYTQNSNTKASAETQGRSCYRGATRSGEVMDNNDSHLVLASVSTHGFLGVLGFGVGMSPLILAFLINWDYSRYRGY